MVFLSQAMRLPYGEARMRHVMSKYDADRSGSVDLEEFTHYMSVGASGSDETAHTVDVEEDVPFCC